MNDMWLGRTFVVAVQKKRSQSQLLINPWTNHYLPHPLPTPTNVYTYYVNMSHIPLTWKPFCHNINSNNLVSWNIYMIYFSCNRRGVAVLYWSGGNLRHNLYKGVVDEWLETDHLSLLKQAQVLTHTPPHPRNRCDSNCVLGILKCGFKF